MALYVDDNGDVLFGKGFQLLGHYNEDAVFFCKYLFVFALSDVCISGVWMLLCSCLGWKFRGFWEMVLNKALAAFGLGRLTTLDGISEAAD